MPIQATYREAKIQFAKLWNEVITNQEVVIISKRGTEDVALIAASELSELLETRHLLRPSTSRKRLHQTSERAESQKGKRRTPVKKATKDTEAGYREMANDEFREAEASAWAEITIGDLADESR